MSELLNSPLNLVIFVTLAVVVFALAIYLGTLRSKLNQQKKESIELQKQIDEAARTRDKFLVDSILIISKATTQKQCEPGEACIRIKNLIENYPDLVLQPECAVIEEMYQDLKKFAILDDRKKLTKQERFDQDKERFAIEDKYSKDFMNSLNYLITHFENKH